MPPDTPSGCVDLVNRSPKTLDPPWFGTCKMRRLEQALYYMDRNTIPNINTTSFAFEQNIKYNTR
jgi:hypothetical protein